MTFQQGSSRVAGVRREAASFAAVMLCSGAAAGASADDAPLVWASETASPAPSDGSARDRLEQAAITRCGLAESGLDAVARALVAQKVTGAPMPGADAIELLQRAAGEPHPWATAWTTRFGQAAADAALGKLDAWLANQPPAGVRRCGAARAVATDGAVVLAVVAVDALADLDPLPVRARTGQWLTVLARLHVRARSARVVVLGPSGSPRAVPATFDGSLVRARFAVDRPGELAVQVVADVDGGPRPVLEATVFGDVEPPAHPGRRVAPGEDVDVGWAAAPEDERLARMLLAARLQAGVPPLSRDARLDAIAQAHAARMAARRELAHDAGDGSPMDRLRAEGLDPGEAGENLALATTPALAHRALWNSPSHRANTLKRELDRVGIGVVRDDRGDLWVAELFVGGRGLLR